jgi:hypothetical protein
MAQKKPSLAMVSFKVEAELAELLDQLPNKSEFIRKAIAAQLRLTCPLCNGKGAVSGWMHEKFAPLIHSMGLRSCVRCGDAQIVPSDPSALRSEDCARLEQFFHGGPLYCDNCYQAALPCDACGWHIDGERIEDHRRAAHPG